jgi:predicted aminopeptidase
LSLTIVSRSKISIRKSEFPKIPKSGNAFHHQHPEIQTSNNTIKKYNGSCDSPSKTTWKSRIDCVSSRIVSNFFVHSTYLLSLLICLAIRGCMGMTAFYGNFDRAAAEEESLRTIARALELGINFLDTAWIYQVI